MIEEAYEAVDAIAEKAIKRNTGARGLRTIVEEIMQDIMYEIPSDSSIKKVTITKECVEDSMAPEIIREAKPEKQKTPRTKKTEGGKEAC